MVTMWGLWAWTAMSRVLERGTTGLSLDPHGTMRLIRRSIEPERAMVSYQFAGNARDRLIGIVLGRFVYFRSLPEGTRVRRISFGLRLFGWVRQCDRGSELRWRIVRPATILTMLALLVAAPICIAAVAVTGSPFSLLVLAPFVLLAYLAGRPNLNSGREDQEAREVILLHNWIAMLPRQGIGA
jgi:hypothetical protein